MTYDIFGQFPVLYQCRSDSCPLVNRSRLRPCRLYYGLLVDCLDFSWTSIRFIIGCHASRTNPNLCYHCHIILAVTLAFIYHTFQWRILKNTVHSKAFPLRSLSHCLRPAEEIKNLKLNSINKMSFAFINYPLLFSITTLIHHQRLNYSLT